MTDPAQKPAQDQPQEQEDADAPARLGSILLKVAYEGQLGAVREMIKNRGADVAFSHHETGLTALHLAIGIDNLPLVRFLVEECGAPFVPDRFGRWPTVIAAECCVSEELCDYIVEKEAAAVAAAK